MSQDITAVVAIAVAGVNLLGLVWIAAVKATKWDHATESIQAIERVVMEDAFRSAFTRGVVTEHSPYGTAPYLGEKPEAKEAGRRLVGAFRKRSLPADNPALATQILQIMGTDFCLGRSKVQDMALSEYLVACAVFIRSERGQVMPVKGCDT